jgi:hydrogenase maturation protease
VAIGVGNLLLCDDGVGVRVIEALRRQADTHPGLIPDGTRVVDGGTLGLGLLDELDGARGLLLIDAVDLGLAAGTVTILEGAAIAASNGHSLPRVTEVVAAARMVGLLPGPVSLVGVQLGEIKVDLTLSPAVAAAAPRAVGAAIRELWRLDAAGGQERARATDAPCSWE